MTQNDPLADAIAKVVGTDPSLRLRTYVRHNLEDIEKKALDFTFDQIAKGLELLGVRDLNGKPPNRNSLWQAVRDEREKRDRPSGRPLRGRPPSGQPRTPKHPSKVF